jgi:exopolysaccharide biosynthesis protein
MFIVTEGEVSGHGLAANGALQSFSFGPALVDDGKLTERVYNVQPIKNPRTAFGQAGPLHYVFVVVDGRTNASKGVTVLELANILLESGCYVAYNLDGGGSSCMWFNGAIVNTPSDGSKVGERSISDIIFIPTPDSLLGE